MVVLSVVYIVQLTLYFVGTIVFNVSAVNLLNLPPALEGGAGNHASIGTFLSNMNVELQAGLAVEGLVILAVIFVQAFRRRPDTGRLD